jgi:hypothetical protein
MDKFKVTLELTTGWGNPRKWDWHTLLDLDGEESVFVEVERVEA